MQTTSSRLVLLWLLVELVIVTLSANHSNKAYWANLNEIVFRLVLEDTGRKGCLSHGSPATTAIFDEKTDEENVQEVDQHPLLLWL